MIEHYRIRHVLTVDDLARIMPRPAFQALQHTVLCAYVILRLAYLYPKVSVPLSCILYIVILRFVYCYVYNMFNSCQSGKIR